MSNQNGFSNQNHIYPLRLKSFPFLSEKPCHAYSPFLHSLIPYLHQFCSWPSLVISIFEHVVPDFMCMPCKMGTIIPILQTMELRFREVPFAG